MGPEQASRMPMRSTGIPGTYTAVGSGVPASRWLELDLPVLWLQLGARRLAERIPEGHVVVRADVHPPRLDRSGHVVPSRVLIGDRLQYARRYDVTGSVQS